MLTTINVALNNKINRSYKIIIGRNILKDAGSTFKRLNLGKNVFVITDSTVNRIYGKTLSESLKKAGFSDTGRAVLPSGEASKSFASFLKIQHGLYDFDRYQNKKVLVATLGGGVPGDLGGFVAGTYKRGVNYIQLPTTLLGFVDCGLGGKTAINFREAKNSIGLFWQPKLVYMDIDCLKSLPLRELRSGLAETVKYGVIQDPLLFNYLELNTERLLSYDMAVYEKVIPVCVRIKAKVTSADERDEKDIRIMLNFGHTVGHAIEAATNYKKYTHGEAIAIGMCVAGDIAVKLNIFRYADLLR
ncbi:MAG: 3-dehydroquinate synthase family protein, partial [Candidatus Firestonebacteria bacterium]